MKLLAVHKIDPLPKISNFDTWKFGIKIGQPTGMYLEKGHLIRRQGMRNCLLDVKTYMQLAALLLLKLHHASLI
jgi:hypothetical protein